MTSRNNPLSRNDSLYRFVGSDLGESVFEFYCFNPMCRRLVVRSISASGTLDITYKMMYKLLIILEARDGIEPTYAALQAAA